MQHLLQPSEILSLFSCSLIRFRMQLVSWLWRTPLALPKVRIAAGWADFHIDVLGPEPFLRPLVHYFRTFLVCNFAILS